MASGLCVRALDGQDQNKNDPKQKVGCSTPERPTSKYIEAHADKYKKKSDAVPLKPILVGTGTCARDLDGVSVNACGGPTRGGGERAGRGRLCRG